jgi:hypothetical protein
VTKFLQAWRERLRGASNTGPTAVPASAVSAQDLLCVQEVAAADFFAGGLFRRKFRVPPPDFPMHFVSFYRAAPSDVRVVGYVHYSEFEDGYLCGGLVIDDRLYRRMPSAHREAIRKDGGIAEHLLRASFARLGHAAAIWGYVGDSRAERVDERVGFRRTDHPYVMVCWMRDLPDADKRARIARVVALGAF